MNRRLLLVPCFLVACGDDGPTTKIPDATVPNPDAAARVCTSLTAAATQSFFEYSMANNRAIWRAATTEMLPDGNRLLLQFEFYGGIEASLAGTFDLAAGNQNNYATCAICVHGLALDAGGNLVKEFYQMSGSVTLTEDPFTNLRMVGSFTNLRLQEVTIDDNNNYTSTPVANGACGDFAPFNVDRDRVPDAWTCTKDKYDDTANNCDCVCGVSDPDCATSNVPATGCTTVGDVCYNDACVTPPVNDTCQMAIPIVVNATATTGTTIGAAKNYNLGLQGTTCTGSSAMAGADVAYAVVLTNTQAITVTLSGLPATYDGAIALLGPPASTTPDPTVCDANPITTCIKGADAGNEGQNDTFTYTATADGTYYIIVDSFYAAQAGAFTLTVTSP